MTDRCLPIWDEGMMLSPQHFQQLSRWVVGETEQRSVAHGAFDWGFATWELDPGALQGGIVQVVRCAGMFRDGTTFRCPDRDLVPTAQPALEFFGEGETLTVYLAQPLPVAGASSVADEVGMSAPSVRQGVESAVDEVRPQSRRPLSVARSNLQLRFEGQPLDGYRTMVLAKLVRAEGGGVRIAEGFCAPALTLRAAPSVLSGLAQVRGALAQKWDELAKQRRDGSGSAELSALILMAAVSDGFVAVRHLCEAGGAAPEAAHLELQRVAARLCSFDPAQRVPELPAYDHADPGPSFQRLVGAIMRMLGGAAPSRCAQIKLERAGDGMFNATLPSADMLAHSRLILSVKSARAEEEVAALFGRLTKLTSRDRIFELLQRAVEGLPLRHVAQPPASVPVRPGRTYFMLEDHGEHWDAVSNALTIALHVPPAEFPELDLELLAAREG